MKNSLQEETDSGVLSTSSFPTMKDRPSMPYTQATLNETLRYSCLVPLSLSHANTEAVEINGYHIPKRCVIMPNIMKIHFDPKRWINPESFDPSRFLSINGNDLIKQDAYMPFSIGSKCIFHTYIFLRQLPVK